MNITLNAENGICLTIKANHGNTAIANMVHKSGTFRMVGVIVVPDDGRKWKKNIMSYEFDEE